MQSKIASLISLSLLPLLVLSWILLGSVKFLLHFAVVKIDLAPDEFHSLLLDSTLRKIRSPPRSRRHCLHFQRRHRRDAVSVSGSHFVHGSARRKKRGQMPSLELRIAGSMKKIIYIKCKKYK